MKKFFQNPGLNNILSILFVTFWIFLFYQKINLSEKISHRPTGEHIWAQIDRASMALTYYEDSAPFLLPRCHQATNNPDGITAGEFPLIPYSVSKLYSIFGFNEIYHRRFVLCMSLIGFLFSFFLAKKLISSPFWAAFSSLLWMASPNIIYYSISFLPDTTALSFIILSCFFLLRNQDSPKTLDWFGFTLFFALAALVRVSAIFPLSAISLAYFISYFPSRIKLRRNRIIFLISCIIPICLAIGWVLYARWILDHYRIFTFLMNPAPARSNAEFMQGLHLFFARSSHFYVKGFYYLIAITTLWSLFFLKKSNRFLGLATLFIYCSFIVLFLGLFQKGIEHSYYWVPFQIGVFFHVAWLVDLGTKIKMPFWASILTCVIAIIFINYNAIHIDKNVKLRWNEKYGEYASYYKLEEYLDSLGIHYGSRVVSYSDPTYNNTLYLMNRKGWSLDGGEGLDHFQKAFQTCDYAVLNDTSILNNETIGPYFDHLMGKHENLFIYSLKPSQPY